MNDKKRAQESARKVTVALHTRDHADRLRRLLKHEGVSADLVAARLSHKLTDHPIEVRVNEDDIPAVLRIIENIEIFPLYDEATEADITEDREENDSVERQMSRTTRRVGLRRKTVINRRSQEKTILVPVDFSEYSFTAARLAFDMASGHGASIVLLYAYVAPSRTDSFSITPDSGFLDIGAEEVAMEIDKVAKRKMEDFSERIKEYIKTGVIPAVKFTTEVYEGLAEEVILEYARNVSPMLIVMGTRGADKKESDMIGSVTAEVLDSCRSVAFTVPESMRLPIPKEGMRQVAFFANLDNDDFSVLDKVHELFPTSPFHINREMEMLLDYCKVHYPGYVFDAKTVSGVGDIEDFEKMQQERPMEMIIIPNKRKNALARLFNPGLAHRLLFHCDIPMLAVPV